MKIFKDVAQMKLATLQPGQLVKTLGYYDGVSGGEAEYLVVAAGTITPDEYGDHTLANGSIAVLQSVDTLAAVTQFGAVGDGVVDDTNSVAAALTAQQNVLITTGTFNLATWTVFTTTRDLSISGAESANIILPAAESFIKTLHNTSISNILITGGNSVIGNVVGDTSSLVSLSITGCTFTGGVNVINIEKPISDGLITNNTFLNCEASVVRIGTNDEANEDTWQNCRVSDNYWEGTNSATEEVRCVILYGRNHIIANNVMVDTSGNSGDETHAIYTKVRFGVIDGNTIRGMGVGSSVSCINIKGIARGEVGAPHGYGTVCNGNSMYCGGVGSGIRARCSDLIISNNYIEDSGSDGIEKGTGEHNRVKIVGNKIYQSSGSGLIGIRGLLEGDGLQIINNDIQGYDTGISFKTGAGSTATNVLVTGNLLRDGVNAIEFDTAVATSFTDVIVSNNSIDTFTAAYRFNTGDKTERLAILDNTVFDVPNLFNAAIFPKDVELRQTITAQSSGTTIATLVNVPTQTGTSYWTELAVSARQDDNTNWAAYRLGSLISNAAGSAVSQGSETLMTDIETDATWRAEVIPSGTTLRVRVVGGAGATVNWKVSIHMISV